MSDKKKAKKLNRKDSQLIIRISATERDLFIDLCDRLDTSAAREIRQFIRSFLAEHNAALTIRPSIPGVSNGGKSQDQGAENGSQTA